MRTLCLWVNSCEDIMHEILTIYRMKRLFRSWLVTEAEPHHSRILTDQEVPRRVESQIMRAEAWKGISSMAKLRRLHIVRMNSRNRYLRFGESICKFIRKTTPLVVKKMAFLKDDDRIVTANKIINIVGSMLYPQTTCPHPFKHGNRRQSGPEVTTEFLSTTTDAYANQTATTTEEDFLEDDRAEISISTFLKAAQKLESVHSSLHDYIVYKCNVENDVIKVLEGFLKIIYFGDYHKLLNMIEQYFAH
ncbi:uncharacterized protein [Dermacentor albipictus]|uniref:uncharacterized protein isoform X2 n=1 Tax=Dermacentor albipictus TaxID=60249 RepID=UPI0038FC82F2